MRRANALVFVLLEFYVTQNNSFSTIFFFEKKMYYFMYVSTPSLSSETPEEGIGSHQRWLPVVAGN